MFNSEFYTIKDFLNWIQLQKHWLLDSTDIAAAGHLSLQNFTKWCRVMETENFVVWWILYVLLNSVEIESLKLFEL